MLLVGTRRGGKAHPSETQIVPQSPRAMRGRLREMQLGHPSAATGGGQVMRGSAAMRYWRQVGAVSRICAGGGGRDLFG